MFRFGKQVESALLAVKALSTSFGSGLSISEICLQHGISKNTLSKIMQNLQSHGLVSSSQGLKGGYRLSRPLEKIDFYSFLEALGEIKKLTCNENEDCGLFKNCSISSPLLKWEKKMEQELKSTSLKELLVESYQQTTQQPTEAACL